MNQVNQLSQRDMFLIGHIMVDAYCQGITSLYIYPEHCDNTRVVIECLEDYGWKVEFRTDCYKVYR